MKKLLIDIHATIEHLRLLKDNAKNEDEKTGYTSAILLLELLYMEYE